MPTTSRISLTHAPLLRNQTLNSTIAVRRPTPTGPFICALVVGGAFMNLPNAQGATPAAALAQYRVHNPETLEALNRAGRYLLAEPTATFETPANGPLEVPPNLLALEEAPDVGDNSASVLLDQPTPTPATQQAAAPAPVPEPGPAALPATTPSSTFLEETTLLLLAEVRWLRESLQALHTLVDSRL